MNNILKKIRDYGIQRPFRLKLQIAIVAQLLILSDNPNILTLAADYSAF